MTWLCSTRGHSDDEEVATVPRQRPTGRPSLIDVAERAGVAPITVSRVVNGSSTVRPATRSRVLDAMSELGYQPNTAARALATGRFQTVGLVTFSMASYGNTQTIAGVIAAADEHGYSVVVEIAHANSPGEIRDAVVRLRRVAVDGVVVIMERPLSGAAELRLPAGPPVVVADGGGASPYVVVDSDQGDGARQAVAHLLGLGHPTVHHVAGPRDSFAAVARVQAWRATLAAAGRAVVEPAIGDWSSDSGYQCGRRLAAEPDVSAIFVANDQMALGVLRALHESGRAVPDDVSVVGFDNLEGSDSFWPPLTTVQQDFAEIGRRCVESLVTQLATSTASPARQVVPVSLVIRDSTGPRRS